MVLLFCWIISYTASLPPLGVDELEASWRHGLPRSRPTWNRSPYRESSATQDDERTGWKCLASSHRTWSASVRDVVNTIGDAGSTRPGWMPTQVQVSLSPPRFHHISTYHMLQKHHTANNTPGHSGRTSSFKRLGRACNLQYFLWN